MRRQAHRWLLTLGGIVNVVNNIIRGGQKVAKKRSRSSSSWLFPALGVLLAVVALGAFLIKPPSLASANGQPTVYYYYSAT